MSKECPFNKEYCDSNCALYINPDDLNETVKNKLSSIGVITKEEGICSFKVIALSSSRYIFEKSLTGF